MAAWHRDKSLNKVTGSTTEGKEMRLIASIEPQSGEDDARVVVVA